MESMHIRFVILLLLLAPFVSHAASISNAGFIPAPLWFSRDTFFAGETVRIYTVVYNGSDSDIRGTVEFLNGTLVVGSDDFSLAKGGRSQDIWIDWKATEGEHRVSARIVRARAAVAGGKEELIDLSQALTGDVSVSVDSDTDKDGVGNKVDPDDDNDGISDADEIRAGTNPLVKDAPPKSEANKDSVSYNTNSPADKVVDVATEKASDTGSAALSFTESLREKGSILLDKKTAEARKEVNDLGKAEIAGAMTSAIDSKTTTSSSTTRASRAKELAEADKNQGIFSKLFSSAKGTAQNFDTNTPFAYLKLFLYTTLAFLFRHAIFFYALLVAIAYYLTRSIIRFVRSRR